MYIADELAEKYGHCVLRLPPYHCIFNPIEHIWGITKTYYNNNIGSAGYGQEKAVAMWKKALETATPEIWKKCIEHTEKEIQTWWSREIGFDRDDINPLIINVAEDSDEVCLSSDSD